MSCSPESLELDLPNALSGDPLCFGDLIERLWFITIDPKESLDHLLLTRCHAIKRIFQPIIDRASIDQELFWTGLVVISDQRTDVLSGEFKSGTIVLKRFLEMLRRPELSRISVERLAYL